MKLAIPGHRRSLYFSGPRTVHVVREPMPVPGAGELLVETCRSAISPGTEMLFYRGQIPQGMEADSTIQALAGVAAYPFKYGYASVGRVAATAEGVDSSWLGRTVFAFHPHESHFVVRAEQLIPIPDHIPADKAVFLPNVETAVNLILDGQPALGERVLVFGQGVVGLLTTALLARFPLAELTVVDLIGRRRTLGLNLGAGRAHTPDALQGSDCLEADLVYELSGNPAALDLAIRHTGFDGRVVIGSWYGTKRTDLDLGSGFHRRRIRLISSQVSTIAPHLSGRWTRQRRMQAVLELLPDLDTDALVTHRLRLEEAALAYDLIDQRPEEGLQILFEYGRDTARPGEMAPK